LKTLTAPSLLQMREKSDLMDQVRALKVRPTSSGYLVNGKPIGKPLGTDLLGAIDFASFLAKDAGKRAVSIVLFTDMEDEVVVHPSAGAHLQTFPRFTHVMAFNVRSGSDDPSNTSAGATATKARIQHWMDTINSMKHPESGPVMEQEDIHLIGQMAAVKSVFGWTRR